MKTMALAAALLVVASAGRQDSGTAAEAARRVWAQAVAARGGEAALHAIRSFAITESNTGPRGRLSGPKTMVVVCEPPAKWWEFLDYRPGVLGLSVDTVNRDTHVEWYAYEGGKARKGRRENTTVPVRMAELQYLYFLETGPLRPGPIRVASTGDFDVVETEVDSRRVTFHLDRRTHLPVHVERWLKDLRYWYTLERYEKIRDVLVPTRVGLGRDFVDAKVEVNPDIDPALFDTPPDDVAQPDHWRRYLKPTTRPGPKPGTHDMTEASR